MKKVFIISLVFLFTTLFFLGVYNFAFKKKDPVVATSSKTKQVAEKVAEPIAVAPVIKNKITPISKTGVIGPVFNKKTEKITYYSAEDGTVWQSDPDGASLKQISETVLTGLKDVKWSQDNTKVLNHFVKDGKDVFFEYDYAKNVGTQLKEGLDAAVWDNLGLKMIYKYYDAKTQKRTLNLANPDGSGWQTVAELAIRNVSISQIPLTSIISFWNTQNSAEESKLQTVGIVGGEVKTIFQGRFGADYLWSFDGTKALISSTASADGKNISLGTVDLNGKYAELKIATLASKCVWSADNKTIYCAVPGSIPMEAIMPDDYLGKKISTQDAFWKIDIVSGDKKQLTKAEDGNYDASNLFLSPTEDALFFVNRMDGKLYRADL